MYALDQRGKGECRKGEKTVGCSGQMRDVGMRILGNDDVDMGWEEEYLGGKEGNTVLVVEGRGGSPKSGKFGGLAQTVQSL